MSVIQKVNVVDVLGPRVCALTQQFLCVAGIYVGNESPVNVLLSSKLLNEQLFTITGPLHAYQVVLARVAGNIHPLCFAATGRHDTNTHSGVSFTDFRVRKLFKRRVQLVGVIDHGKHRRAFGIELPVGNVLPVRAPAETVTQEEFFLIHPVESTVDDGVATVVGQLANAEVV